MSQTGCIRSKVRAWVTLTNCYCHYFIECKAKTVLEIETRGSGLVAGGAFYLSSLVPFSILCGLICMSVFIIILTIVSTNLLKNQSDLVRYVI